MTANVLAAQLYTAHSAARNHKTDIGDPIAAWSDLRPDAVGGFDSDRIEVRAWEAAARWVLDNLDEVARGAE